MVGACLCQESTMKLKLISGAALMAALIIPATANAQMFDRNVLIGAGLGGVIGSNLAGGGVQDEGTAIGAVLGGLAGAAYSNKSSRYGGYSSGYNYGGGSGYGYNSGFQGGLGGQPYFGGNYGGSYAPAPMPAPQYIHSGQYVSRTYVTPSTRTYYYQPAPQIVQPPKVTHVYHPAPRVEPVIHRIVHHVPAAPAPQIKTVHIYQPAPAPVYVPEPAPIYVPAPVRVLPAPQPSGVYCYAGSSKRYDYKGREINTGSPTCSR